MHNDILGIASLTCDRVELFSQSLSSISEELYKWGHQKSIIVFDDSVSADIREKKREIIYRDSSSSGQKIKYTGLDEKKQFLENLSSDLPEYFRVSAKYSFFGDSDTSILKGPGGNRNSVLAAFAGSRYISFDDDMILNNLMFPDSSTEIILKEGRPDFKTGLFPDYTSILDSAEPYTKDLFQLYASILGNKLKELNPDFGTGKVRAVMSGFYGGRWSPRPFVYLFRDEFFNSDKYESKDLYKKIKHEALCYLQPMNTLISDAPVLFGAAIGIDSSEIVPPFFPQLRNEDHLWAYVLQACCKDSKIGYLPVALYHDWAEKKPFTDNDFKKAGADLGLQMALIFSFISEKIKNSSNEDRFKTFGESLIELSELPHHKWVDMCRALWHKHVGDTVNALSQLLEKYEREPSFWAKDVDIFIDRLRSTSMDAEAFIPRELHSAGSVEETGRIHRKMLNNYGTLLTHWTQIWDVICRMNEAGEGFLKDEYNRNLRVNENP